MKRKVLFLSMVALMMGSVSMTSCVKNEESTSVTNLRDAKTKQIEAMAAVANAEAAYKAVLAANETALNAANIKVLEAQAAVQQAIAAGEQAAADKAQVELEFQRGVLAARIAEAIATSNAAKAEAELAYSTAMLAYEANRAGMDANPYLGALMTQYATASARVGVAGGAYANAQINMALLNANLVTAEQYVANQTVILNKSIANSEAALAKYVTLPAGNKAAAQKAFDEAKANEIVLKAGLKGVADPLNVTAAAADKAVKAVAETGDLKDIYDAATAATQEYEYTKYDGTVDKNQSITTAVGKYTDGAQIANFGSIATAAVNVAATPTTPATWTFTTKSVAINNWTVKNLTNSADALDVMIASASNAIATAQAALKAASTDANIKAIADTKKAMEAAYADYLAKVEKSGEAAASAEWTTYTNAKTAYADAVAVIATPSDAVAKATAEKKAWEDYKALITGKTYSDAVAAAQAAVKVNETAAKAFETQNDAVTAARTFTADMQALVSGTTDVEALILAAQQDIDTAKAALADLSNGTDQVILANKLAQDNLAQAKLAYEAALAVMDSLKVKIDAELKK